MMRSEWMIRVVVIVFLLGIAIFFLAQWDSFHGYWQRWMNGGRQNEIPLVIHARIPENGGWLPDELQAVAGTPLHLRLTSDDVIHGFAIGQMDLPAVDVEPGKITEVTVRFTRPGTYTFYCTRWCGANHWRMRGTIIVNGGEEVNPQPEPPLYVELGLDIDAPHRATNIPQVKPSPKRGAELSLLLAEYQNERYYRSHSPEEIWLHLKEDPRMPGLTDEQAWDVVALLWKQQTSALELEEGKGLYAQNCAACHGETGKGDGVFAHERMTEHSRTENSANNQRSEVKTTDFTDPWGMLSASPAHLQGKIIRGGMGTGMPMWGTIFTDDQTWSLVNYLFSFQFNFEE